MMFEKNSFQFLISAVLKSTHVPAHSKKIYFGILVVLFLIGVIFWQITTNKEDYLIQRNFRLLSLWDSEITNKIENTKKIFNLSLEQYKDEINLDFDKDSDSIRSFYGENKNRSKEESFFRNYTKFKKKEWQVCEKGLGLNSKDLVTTEKISEEDLFDLFFDKLCVADLKNFDIVIEEVVKDKNKKKSSYYWVMEGTELLLKFKFYVGKEYIYSTSHPLFSKDSSAHIFLTADLNVTKYIRDLFNEKVFDDVLLFHGASYQSKRNVAESKTTQEDRKGNNKTSARCEDGSVIFQRNKWVPSWGGWCDIVKRIQNDSWMGFLNNEEDQKTAAVKGAQMIHVRAPDGDVKILFKHPIQLSNAENVFYIVGIVSEKHFRTAYWSVSTPILIILSMVLVGLVLSVPFVRLALMAPTDPLSRWHVFSLFFSMSLSIGLLALLFLSIHMLDVRKEIVTERMQDSANKIKSQMKNELKQVLAGLKMQGPYMESQIRLKMQGRYMESQIKETALPKNVEYQMWSEREPGVCKEAPNTPYISKEIWDWVCQDHYLDHSLAFWIDSKGDMRIASRTSDNISMYLTTIPLQNRKYVIKVLNEANSLWREDKYVYYMEPVTSWGTGKSEIVASMASRNPYKSGKEQKSETWVAALSFEFLSVMKDVVMPAGTGFAIIDNQDLQVMIHSNARRSQRENFLIEADQNLQIKNLVVAQQSGIVEGRYWGVDTLFYVMPLKEIPWTLVVYREQALFSSMILTTFILASALFIVWILFVSILFLFLKWLCQGSYLSRLVWLWPNQKCHYLYRQFCWLNLLFFIICLIILNTVSVYSPDWLLLISLLILPISSGLLLWFYSWRLMEKIPLTDYWPKFMPCKYIERKLDCCSKHIKILSFPYSHRLMIMSFLLVFSVSPAVGLLHVVYQQEMTATIQDELLQLHKTLSATDKPLVKFQEIPHPHTGLKKVSKKTNSSKDANTNSWFRYLGFYPDLFITTTWEFNDKPYNPKDDCEINTSRFYLNDFYQSISRFFMPLKKGLNSWGHINVTTDDNFCWEKTHSKITLLRNMNVRVVNADEVKYPENNTQEEYANWLMSVTVDYGKHLSFVGSDFPLSEIFGYILLVVLFTIIVFQLPKSISEKVLLQSFPKQRRAPFPFLPMQLLDPESKNLMIIGCPGQGKTQWINKLIKANEKRQGRPAIYFNLKQKRNLCWEDDMRKLITDIVDNDQDGVAVIIDQFDFCSNEASINLEKLKLMEWLLSPTKQLYSTHKKEISSEFIRPIHVISNINPDVFPLSPDADDSEINTTYRARWNVLWSALGIVYCSTPSKLNQNKPIGSMAGHFSQPCYRAIWQSLTMDEQLALFHIARDQFIHYKHPGIHSLLCKGLIEFSPDLHLVDVQFQAFVEYVGTRNKLERQEKSRQQSDWIAIKHLLVGGCIALFSYLLITQDDFRIMLPALASLFPLLFQGTMPDILKDSGKGSSG